MCLSRDSRLFFYPFRGSPRAGENSLQIVAEIVAYIKISSYLCYRNQRDKDMAKTLFIEDNLINLLIKALHWHWVSNPNGCDYIANMFNEEVSADDYEFYPIPTTIVEWEKNGDTMKCDGILFFGDGCVEFHDADDLDAYHWENFTDMSIRKITEIVYQQTRRIGKITFDLTMDGVAEKVELDFEGEVNYAYLTSEDGPWHMFEFNGKTYDCQLYGNEKGDGVTMQINRMVFNGSYYSHTSDYYLPHCGDCIVENLVINYVD